mgnify:CR=1 FL=1
MLLGVKNELKLNQNQRVNIVKHCGVARHVWNWGLGLTRLTKQILDHNQKKPGDKIEFPTAIDLHKSLVALVKPENKWYYERSKSAPQEALRALRKSGDRCFQKISGVPRFKKKGKHDSFTLEGTVTILRNNRIQVPNIRYIQDLRKIAIG